MLGICLAGATTNRPCALNISELELDYEHTQFNLTHFQERGTDSITIIKRYTAEVQIIMAGTGFSCGQQPSPYFTSAMMQQGRHSCDKEYGLCSGASRCPLTNMTTAQDGCWVRCSYTCVCPPETEYLIDPCTKILFVFGEGIRERAGEPFVIYEMDGNGRQNVSTLVGKWDRWGGY